MIFTALDSVIFVVVLVGLVGVGLRAARRVKTSSDWLVAGRNMGFWTLLGTLVMTELNTATMLAFSGAAYAVGPRALTLPLVFLVGLMVYALTVARRYKRLNATSVAELYGARFGPGLQRLASVCFLVAMLGFVATYVRSAEVVFAPVLSGWVGMPLSPWVTSAVLVALVLVVTLGGGLMAVAASDLAAFALTVVGLPVFAWVAWSSAGGTEALTQLVAQLPPGEDVMPTRFIIALMLLTTATYVASPWYGQRMFAAKDERTAFSAVALSAILVTGLYVAASVVAICVRMALPPLPNAESALPQALIAWAPSGLRGLGFAVLLGIVITTMSSMWNTWVAMAVTDFIPVTGLKASRLVTIALALVSWFIANLMPDGILGNMILANIPIAALLFGLMGGLYWRGASKAGAWAATITGVVGAVTCWWTLPVYEWWWAVVAVPVSVGAGVVVSLSHPDPPGQSDAFYARTGAPLIG
ncbi:MAG: SSS family solute:Na+ symporter [Myxococcota bacterium]|jgi:SSS family solute:Na+ symporter